MCIYIYIYLYIVIYVILDIHPSCSSFAFVTSRPEQIVSSNPENRLEMPGMPEGADGWGS